MLRPLSPLVLAVALSVAGFGATVVPALAEQAPAATVVGAPKLAATMRVAELLEILRQEGLDYATSLEDELFPGSGGPGWQRAIDVIHDTTTMQRRFEGALEAEIGANAAVLEASQAFFAGALGQRIVALELEARRELLDEAVEDAAQATTEDMVAANAPRMAALRRFIEANDLIEANVQGALNANLAFYRGMAEEGAFGQDVTEDQMLADVWGQEADVRAETEAWLYPYLVLAYGPLPDADLEAYIAFSLTPEGQRLNAALFVAFDAVFSAISRDLGRAAARQMRGQDI